MRQEKGEESVSENGDTQVVEKVHEPGIECRHGGPEHEQPICACNTYAYPNEPMWSRPEKAITRRLFDAALKRELQDVLQ